MAAPTQLRERKPLWQRGPSGRRGVPFLLASALSAALAVASTSAAAQPRAEGDAERGWIRQWAGFREDLESSDWHEQLRALERLGSSRHPRSRQALVDVVGTLSEVPPSGRGGSSSASRRRVRPAERATGSAERPPEVQGRLRLALARALARHADHADARRALFRLMSIASENVAPHDPWALHTAAFALARSGHPEAIRGLGQLLSRSPALASAAREALLAYPPPSLEPLLGLPPTRPSIELLGELANPEAFDFLRTIVLEDTPARAPLGAWSLFRLGFPETRQLARHWLKHSREEAHRVVALRMLWPTRDPLARRAMGSLLEAAADDLAIPPQVLELLAEEPHPDFERALLRLARRSLGAAQQDSPASERQTALLLALARLDTPAAADALVQALHGPLALAAAEALARTDGPRAAERLARGLGDARRRAWALRILGVRLARGRAEAQRSAFDRAVRGLLRPRSSEARDDNLATDRAAAAWALAVALPDRAAELLASKDEIVARAVARQAFGGPLATAASSFLLTPRERPRGKQAPTRQLALLHACLDPAAAERLPTGSLQWLAAGAGSAAPPVLASLASRTRQPAGLLPTDVYDLALVDLRTWLGSRDTAIQAAALRGLAHADTPLAVALLTEALQWNEDPRVRRAAARALRERKEPAARSALRQAAAFDPDAQVRKLAQSIPASDAVSPVEPPLFWRSAEGPVQLLSGSGESLLLFPDPDGFVGVFGFGPEPWDPRPVPQDDPVVATTAERGEASAEP